MWSLGIEYIAKVDRCGRLTDDQVQFNNFLNKDEAGTYQYSMMPIEFIHQDTKNPTLSDADHQTIRRVSRRAGAATRRGRGVGKKVNALQMPDFLILQWSYTKQLSTRLTYESSLQSPQLNRGLNVRQSDHSYNNPPPSIPFPPTFAPNGRRIPGEMSILMQPDTTANLLRYAAITDANSNPRKWVKICRLAQDSVLQLIPQLYGRSKCLDDSIDCVVTRVRQCFLSGTEGQAGQIDLSRIYGRAVRSLSATLTDTAVDWTVWYASLLLALFELLDNSGRFAWIVHSRGAFGVLEALGPNKITTEIEKDVFIAQVEVMILESSFANVGIFLNEPEWQSALRSTIIPETQFGDRSEPVVTFWMISACAPGLFKRATEVIVNQCFDQKEEIVNELAGLLDKYSKWYARWDQELTVGLDFEMQRPLFDDDASLQRAEVFTRSLAFMALTNRFLFALDPDQFSVAENEATSAASRVVQLGESVGTDSVQKLRIRVAMKIAWSILTTTQQWSERELSPLAEQGGTINPQIFSAWCALLGRVTG